ncbi:hypothetical protein BCR34DRAFT_585145 [Clohesyomyces aquaticus]|uniref:Fungal N-terminal domain-containing protein n=1 Tax=Clohesyomyces aquaticus TaxID=1231657 RepID=A0A1Y1ZYH9_9PLEO|nr:hypothetical protein BCR34DRAFT_585145 [Clohesyomyces aquaticus]
MDPLTITGTVIAISGHVFSTAQALYNLRQRYKTAEPMIKSMHSELMMIGACLGLFQNVISSDIGDFQKILTSQPGLERIIDTSLTDCTVIYSAVADEVQKLSENVESTTTRIKYTWNEAAMAHLFDQLREHQKALADVVQIFQMERNQDSILEIQKILKKKVVPALKLRTSSSEKLRRAYPKMRVPPSIFEGSKDDAASIFSFESVPTATQFDFDRDLANSPVYRRTLSAHEDKIEALRKETAKLVSALNDHTAQDVPVLRAQLKAYEEANKGLQEERSQRMNEREKILERMGKLQESMTALEAQTKAPIQEAQKEITALQTKNRLLKLELNCNDADEEDMVKNFDEIMSVVLEELKASGASEALQQEARIMVERRSKEARFWKQQKEHLSSWDGKTRILPIREERSPWDFFDSDI